MKRCWFFSKIIKRRIRHSGFIVGNSPTGKSVAAFMDMQGQPYGTNTTGDFPDSYLLLLNGLSSDKKLLLAERLIESVRTPGPEKSIDSFYGAWISEKSAEEIIDEIECSRTSTHAQREEFVPEKSAEELIADLRDARHSALPTMPINQRS